MNNIMRNVLMRRSIYTFDRRPVRDDDLLEILEEGKALSNAEDNQAWHFTVLQNKRLLHEFRELINEKIKVTGEGTGKNILLEVPPLLMIISSSTNTPFAVDAANMVFGSMMMMAEKRGLCSCWLAAAAELFDSEAGRPVFDQFGIPKGYRPLCIGIFGYKPLPANASSLETDSVINIIK